MCGEDAEATRSQKAIPRSCSANEPGLRQQPREKHGSVWIDVVFNWPFFIPRWVGEGSRIARPIVWKCASNKTRPQTPPNKNAAVFETLVHESQSKNKRSTNCPCFSFSHTQAIALWFYSMKMKRTFFQRSWETDFKWVFCCKTFFELNLFTINLLTFPHIEMSLCAWRVTSRNTSPSPLYFFAFQLWRAFSCHPACICAKNSPIVDLFFESLNAQSSLNIYY